MFDPRCADTLPTRPIGGTPRPLELIQAVAAEESGRLPATQLEAPGREREPVRDAVEKFAAAGSPVVSDGEARKLHHFATFCVHGGAPFAADSLHQLSSSNDCGFSPFCDDGSTAPDRAFTKIAARVQRNALASAVLAPRLRQERPVPVPPASAR